MAYNINITNGTGTGNVVNGSYSVTASATGYDNTSINPSTVNIVDGTTTYDFTIAATGTLTLHVTEEGTSSGTPVVGATFYRTDSEGNTYGTIVTTDSSGNAVLANVPYSASGAPLIYYKQTASDGSHNFDDTVKSVTMTTSTYTQEISNPLASITLNLTDENYSNLPIGTATITLE